MKKQQSKKSLSTSVLSGKSKTTVTGQNKTIGIPTIPSNLDDDKELKPHFNSIGFYGDLLTRLDDQIKTVEDIYKNTFFTVQKQSMDRESARGKQVYSLTEIPQV